MSDILFLSVKEHAGKIRHDEGTLTGTGDLATLTAGSGKDMYLARAIVTMYTINAGAAFDTVAELKINGVTVETTQHSFFGENGAIVYEFKNIGQKVTTGQIIKLEVTSSGTNNSARGMIECFEENTDESPLTDFS